MFVLFINFLSEIYNPRNIKHIYYIDYCIRNINELKIKEFY